VVLHDAVLATQQIAYQGEIYDFSQPFRRLTLLEAILEYNPDFSAQQLAERDSAAALCEALGIAVEAAWGLGKLQLEIFEKTAEHRLQQPTFITAYPTEVSPLSRRNDADPFVTDRFEFFVAGRELANGFSELNDAEDQAERFRAQVAQKDAGDEEAMHYDADYIRALEYGMPPTAARASASTAWSCC
jgi:lysyl-tRNA synthetase class 2